MKKVFISVLCLFFTSLAFSQSADEITKIINAEKATHGQACYLAAVHNQLVPDTATEAEAIKAWVEKNQLKSNIEDPETFITYQDACFYFARMWNVKGGLLFKLSGKNPRYSYKKFRKDGILPSNADPSKIPSGTDLLNIFTQGHLTYISDMEAAE